MSPVIPYFTPIIFEVYLPWSPLGPSLTISGFGVAVAMGLSIANLVVFRAAARRGLPERETWSVLVVINMSVVIGGSIGHGVFYSSHGFLERPLAFFDIRRGLSSIGGIIFAVLGCLVVLRNHRKSIALYADSIGLAFVTAWPIARLGCVLNHEHLGGASTFFLARYCRPVHGFTIAWPDRLTPELYDFRFGRCLLGEPPAESISDAVPRDFLGIKAVHDPALYEAIFVSAAAIVVFIFLKSLSRYRGLLFFVVAVSYALFRFGIEILRPIHTDPRHFGLTGAQWGLGILVLPYIAYSLRRVLADGSYTRTLER